MVSEKKPFKVNLISRSGHACKSWLVNSTCANVRFLQTFKGVYKFPNIPR